MRTPKIYLETTRMPDNTIEQDINRIRLEIYDETKDMTPEQRVEHTRNATEETIKKCEGQ